jgi:hypothetical protein
MTAEKEKRKGMPRSFFPLLATAIICLFIGAAAAIALRSSEHTVTVPFKAHSVEYYQPATGSTYAIYAIQDIPCGNRIDRDTALVTRTQNFILYFMTHTYYPLQPVWSRSEDYLEDPYVILSGEDGDMYARRDIQRDERLDDYDITMTDKPENIICPTPAPDS